MMKDFARELEQNNKDVDEAKGHPTDPVEALKAIRKMVKDYLNCRIDLTADMVIDEVDELVDYTLRHNKKKK